MSFKSFTLQNIYWEDVCIDALTLKGEKNLCTKFVVKGGAAKVPRDIIIRHNSVGSLYINSFYAQNSQRLYVSCPNWNSGYQERSDVTKTDDVVASNVKFLAAVKKNYRDIVTLKNSKITGGTGYRMYTRNNNGGDPKAFGNQYETSNIYSCTWS